MIRFYSPDIEESLSLPESDSAHCCRVLRMKSGDLIEVTDGKGNLFKCKIENPHHNHTSVNILDKIVVSPERNFKITLALAPTKNSERIEWLVEKAVEIGVDEIVLVKCDRSERKIQKTERLNKIMISAMKQSLKVRLPLLCELMPLKDFVVNTPDCCGKFFGYCQENYPKREFAKEYVPFSNTIVLIGPEGDFSEVEVKMVVENGFIPVTFGNTRLRTETAGLFALAAIHSINQRFDAID